MCAVRCAGLVYGSRPRLRPSVILLAERSIPRPVIQSPRRGLAFRRPTRGCRGVPACGMRARALPLYIRRALREDRAECARPCIEPRHAHSSHPDHLLCIRRDRRSCTRPAPSRIPCAAWRPDARPMTLTRPACRACMHQIRTARIAARRLSNGPIRRHYQYLAFSAPQDSLPAASHQM